MSELVLEEKGLPKTWTYTNLNEVCLKIIDGVHKTPKYTKEGIRFISIANIRPFKFVSENYVRYISQEEHNEILKSVDPKIDDVLVTKIGTLGYAKIVDWDWDFNIFVGLALLRPDQRILFPKFLEIIMNCPQITKNIIDGANGTGRKTLPLMNLRPIVIPIPPLDEQKRIVEKIEEIVSILDSNIKNLKNLLEKIIYYQQSLIESAFNGELTKQWRNENFELIKTENEYLEKKLKEKQKKSSTNFSILSNQSNWKQIPFQLLIDDAKNGFSKRYSNNGIPTVVIRLADIENNEISDKSLRQIKMTNEERKKYLLSKNDLLCIRVNGSDNLVGRMIVCKTNKKWTYSDHLIRYKINKLILPRFISEFFNTKYVRNYIQLNKVSSAGQNTVNQSTLSQVLIPLPTPSEQQIILNKIDFINSLLNSCVIQLKYCLKQHYSIKRSILKKAFEGKLTPQDPNDEPTSILLEKIKQEKEQLKQKEKSKKRKKNAK